MKILVEREDMARKNGKNANLTMAKLLAGSMMMGDSLGLGRMQNRIDLQHIDPPRFVKSKDYYKKNDGHGGEAAKKRRLKQFLAMPIHERIKQYA